MDSSLNMCSSLLKIKHIININVLQQMIIYTDHFVHKLQNKDCINITHTINTMY